MWITLILITLKMKIFVALTKHETIKEFLIIFQFAVGCILTFSKVPLKKSGNWL